MKEINYRTLRQALDALPEYGADAGAWEGIEKAMSPGLAEQLPSYRPPAEVWNGISQELLVEDQQRKTEEARTSTVPASRKPTTVRQLWPRLVGVAVAAALLVSVGIGLLRSWDAAPEVSYAYTQEEAPAPINSDWTSEEESFARVVAEIEARNEPHLNTLGHELAELTEASKEIQAMLVAYGDDPKVVRQLASIERDRSDIYRRIIVSL